MPFSEWQDQDIEHNFSLKGFKQGHLLRTFHYVASVFRWDFFTSAMKERGYSHPMAQLEFRLHHGSKREIEERHHRLPRNVVVANS